VREPAPLRMIPARVALVGAGTTAQPYLRGLRSTAGFEVVAVAARDGDSAQRFAAEHGLAAASLDDILADSTINYLLNLAPAQAHASITRAALDAGKSVYSEKPLAIDLETADALIGIAARRGLLLACAPATFLWPPMVTVRRIIMDGKLGPIAGAMSTLVYPGPELFHPNPEHLYGPGAGPLHDMGVYQVTALMALLGPVVAVCAMAGRAEPERTVRVGTQAGRRFPVYAQTHIHAQLRHESGAVSSLIVSFDALSAAPPSLVVYGRAGSITLANPDAPESALVLYNTVGTRETLPLDPPAWSSARWSCGASQAWTAFHADRPVEASAARARDVLAVLLAIDFAAREGQTVPVAAGDGWRAAKGFDDGETSC
jgi:predicted dehydrogenase